jgi:hypothetical protein
VGTSSSLPSGVPHGRLNSIWSIRCTRFRLIGVLRAFIRGLHLVSIKSKMSGVRYLTWPHHHRQSLSGWYSGRSPLLRWHHCFYIYKIPPGHQCDRWSILSRTTPWLNRLVTATIPAPNKTLNLPTLWTQVDQGTWTLEAWETVCLVLHTSSLSGDTGRNWTTHVRRHQISASCAAFHCLDYKLVDNLGE